MNLLMDPLPDFVEADGHRYRIYTSYRNWIKMELAMTDRGLSPQERAVRLLALCYPPDGLPPDISAAFDMLMEFYRGGEETYEQGERGAQENVGQRPVYSFREDGNLIYSEFFLNGIDLQKTDLHWWQFKALFSRLLGTPYKEIIGYRAMDLSAVKDKQQRRHYARMKAAFRLPDRRTPQEMEWDMVRGLETLF